MRRMTDQKFREVLAWANRCRGDVLPCIMCGEPYIMRRRNHVAYCSTACKQRAYRKRERAAHVTDKLHVMLRICPPGKRKQRLRVEHRINAIVRRSRSSARSASQ